MKMKGKPDTTLFKLPKDPTAFLEGGEADKAEKPRISLESVIPVTATELPVAEESTRRGRGRVPKIFNFSEDLADRLREEALVRTRAKGGRVTEKDIVVEALEALLKSR
jgi:hypothetical protein